MGKGAQGKKITNQTKRQKEYLLSYEKMDQVSFLQKAVSESLEKLALPEASWTLPELKATGRKFTYEFAGKTEEKTPYNNFLTGYNTLHSLISLYRFLAELAWCMESNTNKCKEYLYLAAYCQKCICQWPDHDENHNSIGLVSLSRLDLFYMALIADANTEFIKKLGELLSIPERTWNPFLIYRGSAVIRLTCYKEPPVQVADEKKMFALIRASFNQRRKTLVNSVGNARELGISKERAAAALEKMQLPATVRGEALTLEQFAELSGLV